MVNRRGRVNSTKPCDVHKHPVVFQSDVQQVNFQYGHSLRLNFQETWEQVAHITRDRRYFTVHLGKSCQSWFDTLELHKSHLCCYQQQYQTNKQNKGSFRADVYVVVCSLAWPLSSVYHLLCLILSWLQMWVFHLCVFLHTLVAVFRFVGYSFHPLMFFISSLAFIVMLS